MASADTVPLPLVPLVPLTPEDYATHLVHNGIKLRLNRKVRMCTVGFREMTPAQKFAALPKTGWIPVGWASYDPSAERIERSDGVVVRVKPRLTGRDLQWDWQLLSNDEKLARDVWEPAAEPPAQRATTSSRVLRRINSNPAVDAVVAKPPEAVVVALPRKVERTSIYGKLEFKTLARLPSEFKLQYFYDQWGQNSEGGWCAHSSVTLAAALQIGDDAYVRRLRSGMVKAGHLEVRTVRGKRLGDKATEYRSCNSATELERGQAACDAWNQHIGGRIGYAMPGAPRATSSRALKATKAVGKSNAGPVKVADPERDALIQNGLQLFEQQLAAHDVELPVPHEELVACIPKLRWKLSRFPAEKLAAVTFNYLVAQWLLFRSKKSAVKNPVNWFRTAVGRDFAKSAEKLLEQVAETQP